MLVGKILLPLACRPRMGRSLADSIDLMVERRSLLDHPFYQKWSEGTLPVEALALYSREYYLLVRAIPEMMSPIIAAAPACAVAELEANRQEEHDHIRLWEEFAGSLHVGRDELRRGGGLEKTVRAVADLRALAATCIGGACAMYALEKEIPKISAAKLDGLAKFYGIDGERETEYFRLHTEADVRHAASWRALIGDAEAGGGPEAARLGEDAASRSISAQHLLLDSCLEAGC